MRRNPSSQDLNLPGRGAQIAGGLLVALGGLAVIAWRVNQRREDALNARTWARLLPQARSRSEHAPLVQARVVEQAP